jgi:hypothetical protein
MAQDPAFSGFVGDGLEPYIEHPTAGSRVSLAIHVLGMLDVAWIQLQLDGVELTEENYVKRALENLAELERLPIDHEVQAHHVTELAGLQLQPDMRVALPWGTVISTPSRPGARARGLNAVLVEHLSVPVTVSYEADPPMNPVQFGDRERHELLVPLAFLLGTIDSGPHAPAMAYRSLIVPYTGGGGGSGPSFPLGKIPHILTKEEGASVSEMAMLIESNHRPHLDIAARRLVQSVQSRFDPQDVLIDAVTAWEGLVGTDSETTFRVCASLTILLEPDHSQRESFHRRLKEIYRLRSQVVHGARAKSELVSPASAEAVVIAARAITELYRRGPEWTAMESRPRADRLLLGW